MFMARSWSRSGREKGLDSEGFDREGTHRYCDSVSGDPSITDIDKTAQGDGGQRGPVRLEARDAALREEDRGAWGQSASGKADISTYGGLTLDRN